MKNVLRNAVIAIAIGVLASTQAKAQGSGIVVGFNQDMRNNTGQPAYDFHIYGELESGSQPIQISHYEYSDGMPPHVNIYGWTYLGHKIKWIPGSGNKWSYEGSWGGTTPIPPGGVIHLGKYFLVNGFNVFMHVYGYWTDANGNKINANAGNPGGLPNTWVSDVCFIGFDVNDTSATLTVNNATANETAIQGFQAATTPTMPDISELVSNSTFLATLSWKTVPISSLASGDTQTVNLASLGLTLTPGRFLLLRGNQSIDQNNWTFFADIHGISPMIPPGPPWPTLPQWGLIIFGVALLATGAFFILRKRPVQA